MNKKILFLITLLVVLIIPTIVFAATPTVTVKINGTTLNTSNTYTIDEGQSIVISGAYSGGTVSKIYYKIGSSDTQNSSGSSKTITIPTSYTNTGVFSLNVLSLGSDGVQSGWQTYKLQVVKETQTSTPPTMTVKVNGTTLNTSNTYTIDEGQSIAISASHSSGISKLYYKIGTSTTQNVSASSKTITIPTSYTNTGVFSLNVCAVSNDGTQCDWKAYKLQVIKETTPSVPPTMTVKVNGTTLNTSNTYTIDEGQAIDISASHSLGISKIQYKIGTSTTQNVSASSKTITVPTSYTNTGAFTLNVCATSKDGVTSEWKTYKLQVVKEVAPSTPPTMTVKVNGTTLNTSNTYTIDEGQAIAISASHSSGISNLYYKIGTGDTQNVSASSKTITVPTSYTNTGVFSLNVCAISKDGTQCEWQTYNLQVIKEETAVQPTVIVKVNETTLNTYNTYTIDEGQAIAISASHAKGISKIQYKIGTGTTQTVNASSKTMTIPTSYTNKGTFSLNVTAFAKDGTQCAWQEYKLQVVKKEEKPEVVQPTVTVKVNGTTLNTTNTYTIDEGQTVAISASHSKGISKIYYKIGTSTMQSVNGSSANITIPTSYTNNGAFSFNVCAEATDGTQSDWVTYNLQVIKEETAVEPILTVQVNGTTLNTYNTYKIDEGQVISVSANHTKGISKIQYKIGTGAVQTVNDSSANITIPTSYTNNGTFSVNITAFAADGTQCAWQEFKFQVVKDVEEPAVAPTITVKVNGTTLDVVNTYKIDEGQVITISASHAKGISKIQYIIADNEVNTVNGSSTNITIPDSLANAGIFGLKVYAEATDGTQTDWKTYKLQILKDVVLPTIKVFDSNNALLAENNVNALYDNSNIKYEASHENGIKEVVYWFENESKHTLSSSDGTINVDDKYKDGEKYEFNIYTVSEDGVNSGTKTYYIKYVLNDKDYDLLLNDDEMINNNLDSLAISIRNITVKDGNNNAYALNEGVKYYINYKNGGSDITDKVTIKFEVPQNVGISYLNTMDGKIVSDDSVEWTFNNGLSAGECGTIILTLKYTSLNGSNFEIIQPQVTIQGGSLEDNSAVVNYVYKDSKAKLNVSHIPYMFGDAGDTTFRPEEGLNRAEMAIILVRIFGLDLVENPVVTYNDADVIARDQFRWSTQAIMTVTECGLMEGYEDGTFRPGEKVTKAQMMTIIARRFEMNGIGNINPYKIKENPITVFKMSNGHWATIYISQLMRLNMISGVLNPYDNVDEVITRAEVTRLINACLFRGPSVDGTNGDKINAFSDVNKQTKYYTDILEATATAHNAKFNENGLETIIK